MCPRKPAGHHQVNIRPWTSLLLPGHHNDVWCALDVAFFTRKLALFTFRCNSVSPKCQSASSKLQTRTMTKQELCWTSLTGENQCQGP